MIHSSSIVAKNAEIHDSTNIGPFCIIGDGVKIGKNNNLISHVSIMGNTTIEDENVFYPFCSIGSEPQDLKFNNEISFLKIGSNNKFRENVTVNPGTSGGGLNTIIEDNCLFMVGSHVAHDCKIQSNVILANNATLAGHVEVHNNAILGGNSAIHQFVRVGKYAMIGGMREGASSVDGRVQGSYVHGLFSQDSFRRAFLGKLGISVGGFAYDTQIEDTLDRLAEHIETYLDVDKIFSVAT